MSLLALEYDLHLITQIKIYVYGQRAAASHYFVYSYRDLFDSEEHAVEIYTETMNLIDQWFYDLVTQWE